MGRGKIEIKKIENPTARQVTFFKRRFGLLKKAKELAILCEAEVAVVVFSSSGKLFEFASNCMSKTFARYQTVKGQPSPSAVLEEKFFTEMAALREENERLKLHNRRMMGMELSDLDRDELKYLENQLNEGISSVKDMKEKILLEQLEQSQMKVQELQRFLPATNGQSIACIHSDNQGRGKCNSRYKIAAISAVHNCANEKQDDSDTALHLGLAGAYNKRNLLERASKTY